MKTLIHGGFIVDGSGAPLFRGDVLIENGIIREAGSSAGSPEPDKQVDASGKIVCPGFIDLHRHCDTAPLRDGNFGFLEISQGITTCMAGNCGMAPVPNVPAHRAALQNYLAPCLGSFENERFSRHREYAARLRSVSLPLDMGFYAGMGAIRIAVKGFDPGPITPKEMDAARAFLREALDCGALGMSVGLMYVPEIYGSAEEIAALAGIMKGGKGILCAHMRSESSGLVKAVREVISAAKKAEVPLEISHFKAAGIRAWHSILGEAIAVIEDERSRGMDITADFYPYDCGASTMMQMLPPAFLAKGTDEAIAGLNKPENIQRLRELLAIQEEGWDNLSISIGWDRTIISSAALEENQKFLGKSVTACTGEFGYNDEAEFVACLMHSEKGKVAIINQSMSQEDIDTIARLPYTSVISDALYGDMVNPHPRLYGAFPRFLRDFVTERKVLDVETAIRKMSALPALRLGLNDRGLLKPGLRGDILVFDPATFTDKADYLDPAKPAAGLDFVFIRGETVFQNGELLRRDAGKVLGNG
jgi:N-acyl-D-amino-acid deacylase